MFAHQVDDEGFHGVRVRPVAAHAALLRDDPLGAITLQRRQQPADLPRCDAQLLPGLNLGEAAVDHTFEDRQSIQL